jgi:hypothetical protein
MRIRLSQHRFITPLALLGLVSALAGAPAEDGKVLRIQPQPQAQTQTAADVQGLHPSRPDGAPRSMPPPPRVSRLYFYSGTRTLVPPAWVRCTVQPDLGYWRQRDLMAEIQWLSRKGFIPVSPIGDRVEALSDFAQVPAGWRAYGISVPAGGTVQVEVQHTKLGWFRLMMLDKWGNQGPGMLQQLVTPQPVMLTYKNPGKEATAVYVIVDDPAWWSDAKNPYILLVRRDWDPAKTDLSQVKMVAGLWGATPSVSAQFQGPSLTGPAVFPR